MNSNGYLSTFLLAALFSATVSMPASAEVTNLPGMWYDQDKSFGMDPWWYHDTNGNGQWDLLEPAAPAFDPAWGSGRTADIWHRAWFNDTTTENGAHDVGEPVTKEPPPGLQTWAQAREAPDNGCWIASAANMLRYIGGPDRYTMWAFTAGVTGTDIFGNTVIKTFDDSGSQGEALSSDGYKTEGIQRLFLWSGADPIQWIQARLQRGLPVGIGIPGHALTLYGLDAGFMSGSMTVADSDIPPAGVWPTYSYTAFNNSGLWDIFLRYPGAQNAQQLLCAISFATTDWQGAGTAGNTATSGWQTNWTDPRNWPTGTVPGMKDVAYLQFTCAGAVNLDAGAVAAALYVDGSATLKLNSGADLRVDGNENIGVNSNGTVQQSAGNHVIENSLQLACRPGTSATFTLSGGALSARYEIVGQQGTAVMNQLNGTNVVSESLFIGYPLGSNGIYNLQGGSLSASSIYVGQYGTGVLDWRGGTLCAERLEVGAGGTLTTNQDWVFSEAVPAVVEG